MYRQEVLIFLVLIWLSSWSLQKSQITMSTGVEEQEELEEREPA